LCQQKARTGRPRKSNGCTPVSKPD
jgi:hypothetical protein